MKNITLILPLLFVVLTTGCVRGPVIKIVTDEPADDFVVVCNWSSNLSLHGTGSSTGKDVRVVKSGEVVDCGRSLISRGYVSIMHPVYVLRDINQKETEGNVDVIKPITVLQKIDEQKEKYEAGNWDNFNGTFIKPENVYLRGLPVCGFFTEYLDYYSQIKQVDKVYFKEMYHDILLECKKRLLPIINKNLDQSNREKRPSAEKSMMDFWNSNVWDKYK